MGRISGWVLIMIVAGYCFNYCTSVANGVNEWGGVNSYFLHTLSESDRSAHLKEMQSNGIKVVRIFMNGVDKGAKGSSSTGVSALEPTTVGVYNDDVLLKIDKLMYEAVQYGVKLIIALHDRYALGCWSRDAYVSKYGITDTSPSCDTTRNQPRIFYVDTNAQADFDRAIAHVLTHRNPYFNNRPWGHISEAVLGFEPENEAQGHMDNPDWGWTCRRATTMKKYISNGVLVITGGGVDFHTSTISNHFSCSAIDVIAIHDYSSDTSYYSSKLAIAKSSASRAVKRIIVEEFGATGGDTAKNSVIAPLIDTIAGRGIPWLPWEFLKPGTNTQDYEFYAGSLTWRNVGSRGLQALTMAGAFSWPEISSSCGNSKACTIKGA